MNETKHETENVTKKGGDLCPKIFKSLWLLTKGCLFIFLSFSLVLSYIFLSYMKYWMKFAFISVCLLCAVEYAIYRNRKNVKRMVFMFIASVGIGIMINFFMPARTYSTLFNYMPKYTGAILAIYQGRIQEQYESFMYDSNRSAHDYPKGFLKRYGWFEFYCKALVWTGHEQEAIEYKKQESNAVKGFILRFLHNYKTIASQNANRGYVEEVKYLCAVLLDINNRIINDGILGSRIQKIDENWDLDTSDIVLQWEPIPKTTPVEPVLISKGYLIKGAIFQQFPLPTDDVKFLTDIIDIILQRLCKLSEELAKESDYVTLRHYWDVLSWMRRLHSNNYLAAVGGVDEPLVDRSKIETFVLPYIPLEHVSRDVFIPES